MLEIGDIIDRLKNNCPSFNNRFEAAKSLNSFDDLDWLPAAVVHPIKDDGDENETMGAVSQLKEIYFGIIIAASSDLSVRPSPFVTARTEVSDALIGYQPASALDYIEFKEGEIITASAGIWVWRDVFLTRHSISS